MEGGLNRRKMLGLLAGAALSPLVPKESEAHVENACDFIPSPLEQEDIENAKKTAAEKIVNALWQNQDVRAHAAKSYFGGLTDKAEIARRLCLESRMTTLSPDICSGMAEKYRRSLDELSRKMQVGTYGVFVDGDAQMLHLVRKVAADKAQFMKSYSISMSREPFSNAPNSHGSPLGMHSVGAGHVGLYGEVLAMEGRDPKDYTYFNVKSGGKLAKRPFIKKFGAQRDVPAEIITAAFMLVGPQTPTSRGIFIHGTNYPDMLGRRASGGCIRVASVDAYDLAQYLEPGKLRGEAAVESGTPVMIGATEHVQDPKVQKPTRRNLFNEL